MFFLKLAKKQINISKKYVKYVQIRSLQDIRYNETTIPSISTIKSNFKVKQISFEEGYNNFIINCSICPKRNSLKTKIFVNKKTGAFTCETCKFTGTWNDFQLFLKSDQENNIRDPLIKEDLKKLSNYLQTVKNNSIAANEIDEKTFEELITKFKLPDIVTLDLLKQHNIRFDVTHSVLLIPLFNSANDLVGYKKIKLNGVDGRIEPTLKYVKSSGVIVHKLVPKSSTAIIVANVWEFLKLTAKPSIISHIICLPGGLSNLSLHILPYFEKYSKLILWFGENLTAWETARNFSKKLGERRCYFLRSLSKDEVDHRKEFSKAEPMWHKAIITFASLREEILSDLHNVDRVQGVKWTRFPQLNKILKGHRRGELTVVTGPTGCGKTTFISEYSLDLAMQGVNTLWGSFEIRNARLARTMLQQMAGIPLDLNLDQYEEWADKFEQLPIYYMTFHGQQNIKIVMEAVEHAVYVHDINHVIIDNLQFMMGMTEDTRNFDRFYKQDLIVANFRTFATRSNCHVTLVIHPRKEKESEDLTASSIFGGAKASQEADNILIIQDRRLDSIKGKKFLQVCKNRYSGDLGIMPLEFEKDSLSFVSKRNKKQEPKSAHKS